MGRKSCIVICLLLGPVNNAQLPPLPAFPQAFFQSGRKTSQLPFAAPVIERESIRAASLQANASDQHDQESLADLLRENICAADNPALHALQLREEMLEQNRVLLALEGHYRAHLLYLSQTGTAIEDKDIQALYELRLARLKEGKEKWTRFLTAFSRPEACRSRVEIERSPDNGPVYLAFYLLLRRLSLSQRLELLARLEQS